MAASFLLRSARSALKCGDLASGRPSATGAAAWTASPLSRRLGSAVRLISAKPLAKESDDDTAFLLELAKQREALEVTDDIVNSDAKLHALFLTWLSYNEHHFDVEDKKAFKERFEIFKDTARFVNDHNKSGSSSTCELNQYADMTQEEYAFWKWKVYPKKANQVIAGIAV
ncbi:hypothetical protein MKW92_022581 [Papaver armeniacum]|nr:hypothetical protein MKW92_022581 [Papaver armeniacum]